MADELAEMTEVETIEGIEEETVAEQTEVEHTETETEDDEIVVSIGEESPTSEEAQEQPAPEWVKELRKAHKELKRENSELKAKLTKPTETKPVALGNKPTLEQFDYDAEKFESELAAWYERKREYDAEQAKQREAADQQQREWQSKLDAYNDAKSKLKVKDYDDAELVAQETLNVTQQGIILHGSDNPALLTYALGKNPAKAKELAAINDPVKFAFAVAKLEKELKVSNRKAPPPEKVIGSTGSTSGAVTGSTLERLKAEAQRTGDYTAYMAAKRKSQTK